MSGDPPATAVHELLWAHAERAGERPFLIFSGADGVVELTYAEMAGAAAALAGRLAASGVAAGDRILVQLGNCPEFIVAFFAASLLGAELVPVNPEAAADELAYLLDHARPRLVLAREEIALDAPPAPPPRAPSPRSGRESLAVLYTSGTTGRPKGVMVSHANYLHAGRVMAAHLEIEAADRWLVVLPLFHANAQYYCLMSALTAGASIVLAERFSASGWAPLARRHDATLASLFAAPIRMILASSEQPDDADNRLRVALFAQRVAPEQLEEFERRFGCGLLQIYGMTETIAPPLMNPLRGERRNQTVGRAVAAEVELRGPGGERVEDRGELHVRGVPGETLTAGYLDDPEATAAALADGRLRTGDVMRALGEGWYGFEDRVKDMIKTAGENVAAAEVERVLERHPAVRESAVIGLPDAIRDEVVGAFVVRAGDAEVSAAALSDWCAARLARFKVPARFEFVAELPRTSVGKVQKSRLRAGLRPAVEIDEPSDSVSDRK